MASYNGTVKLSGMISPTDTTDSYPTHEDILGKGGYSSVADITARNNISTLRRKVGMMVFVQEDSKTYQLQGGIDNDKWVEFINGSNQTETASNTLKITTIPVTNLINDIFLGINIPDNEILYVRGNGDTIETTVYHGVLSTVLSENAYNDFIIKYDGTSSVVYVNSDVEESHVQDTINAYPKGYNSVDLTNNNISSKISTLLKNTYTGSIQVFSYVGLTSTISKENNSFEALNKNKEFVVLYDGSNFSAYKHDMVTIDDLKARMVIN